MPATSHRQSTAAVVKAMSDLVTALLLPDGQYGAATPSVTPAFDRVETFDSEDLVEAFRYLIISEQRVCVVVPMEERFESVFQAQKLTVKRELPVMLLISDRVIGSRKTALLGDNDTPGALQLTEWVLPAVTGIVLEAGNGLGAVIGEPDIASMLTVHDTEKELPDRVVMGLNVSCKGGYLEAAMPRGGIL